MNDPKINRYSINLHQKVEAHEPIDLAQAVKIADQYLARGTEKFEDDIQALAATMFGFRKSKSEFIEICVNGPKQISYKYEYSNPNTSWIGKMFGGTFQHTEELQTREQLVDKIRDFFSLSSEELVQKSKARR